MIPALIAPTPYRNPIRKAAAMNGRHARALLALGLFCGLFGSAVRMQGREVMDLDGIWDFATDPDQRGEREHWFQPGAKLPDMPLPGYAPTANGKIRVPGIWINQGYGTETERVRHSFVGQGWYRRQVDIPNAWAGRHVVLAVTGASRYAKTWINGHYLGEHIGMLSAFEYDITPFVVPRQPATIAIAVDSKQRWEVDSLYGACTLADFMDVPWGGIWGHVRLEARSDAWLSDLYARPDVPGSRCAVSATLNGNSASASGTKLEVFDRRGVRVAEEALKLDGKLAAGGTVGVCAADSQRGTMDARSTDALQGSAESAEGPGSS